MKSDDDLLHSLGLILILHFEDPWKYEDYQDTHELVEIMVKSLRRASTGEYGREKLLR
jgi:hypothetical protein